MPTWNLSELMEAIRPQAEHDRKMVMRCIDGLGLYAAQNLKEDNLSTVPKEMRELAETLINYWGLNEHNPQKTEELLSTFDERLRLAETGADFTPPDHRQKTQTICGLQRYGDEMVAAQGEDAMEDILDIADLMKEIADFWDLSIESVENLTDMLEFEVSKMLLEIQLPGQGVVGDNVHGYIVKQIIQFDNDQGIALAENPKAASPFVTWRFTNDNGTRDFHWGKYFDNAERAKVNYIRRVEDYRTAHNAIGVVSVPEFPRPATDTQKPDKPSVMEQIKTSRNAPQQKNDAPVKQKSKRGPEL